MSSEWFTADECERMRLAFRVTAPEALLPETLEFAHRLASKPIAALVETKRTIVAAHRELIDAARERENAAFRRLMGAPANLEAFAALTERRPANFAAVDADHPPDIVRHRAD